jgi:hypothetical protein
MLENNGGFGLLIFVGPGFGQIRTNGQIRYKVSPQPADGF